MARSGFAALIGRPNVGKSTLMNALVGAKVAIVSDKPQTTRHRIAGVMHRPDGQVIFLDTPGVHRPRHRLGEHMARATASALEGVDAALLVVEATSPAPGPGDRRAAAMVARAGCPAYLVLNKIDAGRGATLSAYAELLPRAAGAFAVSALTGEGLGELADALVAAMPEGPPYFPEDVVTDRPEEFLMAELVREQVFLQTRDEVPHAVHVAVDEVSRRPGGTVYVAATIYVERESHKGILIGRQGRMLRSVGAQARAQMTRVFGSPFYLDLRVKVKEGWRDRPGSLESLGYRRDDSL
jgi:GTP-binding protein Era